MASSERDALPAGTSERDGVAGRSSMRDGARGASASMSSGRDGSERGTPIAGRRQCVRMLEASCSNAHVCPPPFPSQGCQQQLPR